MIQLSGDDIDIIRRTAHLDVDDLLKAKVKKPGSRGGQGYWDGKGNFVYGERPQPKEASSPAPEASAEKKAGAPEGNPFVQAMAQDYVRSHGIAEELPERGYASLDQNVAREIADAFEAAQHRPHDPEVKRSYDALKRETKAQYEHAVFHGMTFRPWGDDDPYPSSAEMRKDVAENKHLGFYQGGDMPADHPMAETDPAHGLTYNDMFRAVHDLYGHAAGGYEFGPRGEENAWIEHSRMYSPQARGAMTAETRGQNSWVNFGPHLRREDGSIPKKGEEGHVPPQERPFAEQKATLLPRKYWTRPDIEVSKSLASVDADELSKAVQRPGLRGGKGYYTKNGTWRYGIKPEDRLAGGSQRVDARSRRRHALHARLSLAATIGFGAMYALSQLSNEKDRLHSTGDDKKDLQRVNATLREKSTAIRDLKRSMLDMEADGLEKHGDEYSRALKEIAALHRGMMTDIRQYHALLSERRQGVRRPYDDILNALERHRANPATKSPDRPQGLTKALKNYGYPTPIAGLATGPGSHGATHWRRLPGGGIDYHRQVQIGASVRDRDTIRRILEQRDPHAFISAHRGIYDAQQNHLRHQRFKQELRAAGYRYVPVRGRYSYRNPLTGENDFAVEDSVLIPYIAPEEARAWGRRYGQESVLTHQGFIYMDPADIHKNEYFGEHIDSQISDHPFAMNQATEEKGADGSVILAPRGGVAALPPGHVEVGSDAQGRQPLYYRVVWPD